MASEDKHGAETDKAPTGDATGQEQGGQEQRAKPITFESEEKFQAEIDRRLKERLERERAKAEAGAKRAREEAEAAALAEQKEFQKLAEKFKTQVSELEPKAAQAERYRAALEKHLATQIATVPEHLRKLLARLDVAEQLEYLAENAAALGTAGKREPVPGTPRPGEPGAPTEAERARLKADTQVYYRSKF